MWHATKWLWVNGFNTGDTVRQICVAAGHLGWEVGYYEPDPPRVATWFLERRHRRVKRCIGFPFGLAPSRKTAASMAALLERPAFKKATATG